MEFLKAMGGKVVGIVVGGAVTLVVLIAAVSWFTMSPADRDRLLADTGAVLKAIGIFLGWMLLVGVVPWATFLLLGWAHRVESHVGGINLALGTLIFVYTAAEAVILAWVYGWSVHGAFGWVLFAGATLVAGVYNLLACDWIAEKVS